MGLFYSYSESLLTDSSFNKQFIENVLLGQWYGYFIVVIMQFFILSYIIFKINYNLFNSKILLLLSFYFTAIIFILLYEQHSVSRYRATLLSIK